MGLKNFFNKFRKNGTIIDLSDLQKRGIVKQEGNLGYLEENSSAGVVDLTGSGSDSSSALGFLGSLAVASNPADETGSSESPSYPTGSFVSSKKAQLKGILRDLKEKIDISSDKIYKLSDRLDLIEKKLERLERKARI